MRKRSELSNTKHPRNSEIISPHPHTHTIIIGCSAFFGLACRKCPVTLDAMEMYDWVSEGIL